MKTVLWIFLLILPGGLPAFAQGPFQIEVSAYVGVPIGSTLKSGSCCDSVTRFDSVLPEDALYLLGLSSGVLISDRLHVTLGATYMPVSFVQYASSPTAPQDPPTRRTSNGTSWDFPLLANYRWHIGSGSARLFAGGGLVVLSRMTEGPNQAPAPVINGGIEWVHPTFAVRPEFRYTHFPEGSGSGVHVQRPTHQYQMQIVFTLRTKSR